MTETPVDLTFSRENESGQPFARIECRDKLKIVARIELSHDDLSRALLGEVVLARLTLPGGGG